MTGILSTAARNETKLKSDIANTAPNTERQGLSPGNDSALQSPEDQVLFDEKFMVYGKDWCSPYKSAVPSLKAELQDVSLCNVKATSTF